MKRNAKIKILILFFCYSTLLAGLWQPARTFFLYFEGFRSNDISSVETMSDIPITGANAMEVVSSKFKVVLSEFLSIQRKSVWKLLRQSDGTAIELLPSPSGGTYVRTTTLLPAAPETCLRLFQWERFDSTQRALDPFYHSSTLLHRLSSRGLFSSNPIIIRKVNQKQTTFA